MAIGGQDILWALVGYFSGSIPFGLLLARAAGLGDVRRIGSGNIGATNVLRTGSKKLAAATLLLDMLKGLVPVLAARWWGAGEASALAAGAGAFAGHVFPVWLKFRGGKGVATCIGVLFGLWWPLGLAFVGIWLFMALVARISSLSALTAAASMPFAAIFTGRSDLVPFLFVLGVAIFLTHRENLMRLMRGTEPRIGAGGGRK